MTNARRVEKRGISRAMAFSSIFLIHTATTVFPTPSQWRTVKTGLFAVPTLVMIVDDHAVIRRMVRALLEADGLAVSDAVDGAEGVRKAQAEKPELIILDLSMPVMNGLEAARKLKALMPHVPLLLFTNNAGGIMEKEARAAGIASVISKSDADSSKQLRARVNALLRPHDVDAPRAS